MNRGSFRDGVEWYRREAIAHVHLRPGGELALNAFHPSLAYMGLVVEARRR